MKRIVFDGRGRAVLADAEPPAGDPAQGEIEGRTVVSLASPGTEGAVLASAKETVHPGYASVVEVDRAGPGAEDWIGALAYIPGPHAARARAAADCAVRVPDGFAPIEHAPLARFLAIGMSTLSTTTARPPDPVVVVGLGIVGLCAALAFQRCGYAVAAVEPMADRRATARASGLGRVEDSMPADLAGRVALVLECSGREDAAIAACGLVRPRGEVVLVGVPWRPTSDASAHALLHAVFHRYAVVRSGWEWEVPMRAEPFRGGSIMANLGAALDWIATGAVRPAPGIVRMFPPSDAPSVYQSILDGRPPCLAPGFDWRMA